MIKYGYTFEENDDINKVKKDKETASKGIREAKKKEQLSKNDTSTVKSTV